MKNLIKKVFIKLSRFIFLLIPIEIKRKSNLLETKLETKLQDELVNETYNNFKKHFKNSLIFRQLYTNGKKEENAGIRNYAIEAALLNDRKKECYYLEFGVWKGESANFFAQYVKQLYAFDSFEGLKEDHVGTYMGVGTFSLNKKIPELNKNIIPVVGLVQDTLDDFLKKHNPKINFVHLDMDNYKPTKFVLEKLKPYLVRGAIIIFDELYNYIGWENGEYKALTEVFNPEEFQYKAFNTSYVQCVIQIN